MENYGDIKGLKESLKGEFQSRALELDSYYEETKSALEKEFTEKLELLKSESGQSLDSELAELKIALEASKKNEANKTLQQEKDRLIELVIQDMLSNAKSIVHSKKYLDYLKKQMPKGKVKIYADSTKDKRRHLG